MSTTNTNLSAARVNKNDEFYTRLSDISEEVQHFSKHLAGKIVYCPCDDPTWSKFYEYFKTKYAELQLAKLITTHYVAGGVSFMREFNGSQEVDTQLTGDGDFRSEECKVILDQADIVITNPPFSLFREFVALLQEKQKQFLIIGNNNAITYKDCFKLIKDNKMWLGVNNNKTMEFRLHNSYAKWSRVDTQGNKYGNVPSVSWFTNLNHGKRNQPIDLYKNYSPTEYPKYDNYDAIEVSKVKDIPQDYTGVMGVPITFLDRYCPAQFEILGLANNVRSIGYDCRTLINNQPIYNRILIKHKAAPAKRYLVQIDEPVYGVPITFLDKYCPAQFELLGATESQGRGFSNGLWDSTSNAPHALINGSRVYVRLFIKHKNPVTTQVSSRIALLALLSLVANSPAVSPAV